MIYELVNLKEDVHPSVVSFQLFRSFIKLIHWSLSKFSIELNRKLVQISVNWFYYCTIKPGLHIVGRIVSMSQRAYYSSPGVDCKNLLWEIAIIKNMRYHVKKTASKSLLLSSLRVWSTESCLRSPALSQVYLSLTFQLSQTAVVKGYVHTVPDSVKRSVAESVSDMASVHTRNAAFEAFSTPEQYCSVESGMFCIG